MVKTPYNCYNILKISRQEFETNAKVNNLLLKNALDYDKIGKDLVFRSRREHDKIRLFGRNCTKSLKKLFCEEKISVQNRNRLSILSNDKNDVLWVENCGVDEKYAVDDNTENIVIISTI